ncbi:bifunctional 3'-5' exonuclease/DNA polymerase [Rathayibacter sp. YIM 133350]|uniref:bifunctional 3'-5' exonuclease/DNA polymerase n=1 Tax=Rathayibacter sp. YIM 133350 TaxID=3131992 RepID=UPI00307E63D0
MFIVVGRAGDGRTAVQRLDDSGSALGDSEAVTDLAAFVRAEEHAAGPRWAWGDTGAWYPDILAGGVRVRRCHDLRLSRAILQRSALTDAVDAGSDTYWDRPLEVPSSRPDSLFELEAEHGAAPDTRGLAECVAELQRQLGMLGAASEQGRLALLLAAESAGALIAVEMTAAGLPWDAGVHDEVLTGLLGPRVPHGQRPRRMRELLEQIRTALDDPSANPDSPADLLRSLQRAGIMVESTRAWQLREIEHPVRGPLLEYKKLARLLSANGWSWMDQWVLDGRFRAEYVPGGVVTGRWATRGGGALQLPKQVRAAVRADPGWKLVVADAAQLEPRVLAALSRDEAMANDARGRDLYAGIVAAGAVDSRAHAKMALLGALYGATTGESGRLLPRLARAYPRAFGLVEEAARAGERGECVTSRLGRTSPPPGREWLTIQARANGPEASAADERRARSAARDWGRFTRNFVVQASAAEWALSWMAGLRNRLGTLSAPNPGSLEDSVFAGTPHLVFFLHDEIIVHTPAELADDVVAAVTDAAAAAGRLLFGDFPVDFPLDLAVVDSYSEAE